MKENKHRSTDKQTKKTSRKENEKQLKKSIMGQRKLHL